MDGRLVIRKALRSISMRSLHYGHPERDAMLATISFKRVVVTALQGGGHNR